MKKITKFYHVYFDKSNSLKKHKLFKAFLLDGIELSWIDDLVLFNCARKAARRARGGAARVVPRLRVVRCMATSDAAQLKSAREDIKEILKTTYCHPILVPPRSLSLHIHAFSTTSRLQIHHRIPFLLTN